jgi:enterochelin esterase family protein
MPLLLLLALMAPADPGPRFADVLAAAEALPEPERAAYAAAYWASVPATPLVETDTTAVLLWYGDAASVAVLGDMNAWAEPTPLARLAGTDLWHLALTAEPDARLEYLFLVDADASGFGAELAGTPDPRNPHRVGSGFGPFSELAMPRYAYPDVFAAVRDGTPGALDGLHAHTLPPGALPYTHDVWVYTPPGYDASDARLPTVVFLDGRDYVAFAHAPAVLDDLIARGEIEPVVAAFVDPPNRHGSASPNRTTEYGLNDDFVAFLADDLVPFLDAAYRTRAEPAAWLVVGDSFGGLMATYAVLERPDVFGLAFSQSGYHSFQSDRLIRRVAERPVPPVRLMLDIGTYETTVGAGWLPPRENDFLAANRRMRAALVQRGVDHRYAEIPEGHTWGHWRGRLPAALRHFFPVRR